MIYVENFSPFPLFFLYASNNLVRILLGLGTFHAHYAMNVCPERELRRPFVDTILSIQGTTLHIATTSKPVLNVRIEPNVWKTDVLTLNMNLNDLN